MSKIIWMEMVLLGSSILIFRSVWVYLDTLRWAREMGGLGLLLAVGVITAVFALVNIHRPEISERDKLN